MLIDQLKSKLVQGQGINPLLLRNQLKEILQRYTLNFIYTSNYGKNFLFKGGTCLRFCFDLPRLSEALDFDIKNFASFSVPKLTEDLKSHFVQHWQYRKIETKIAGNNREIKLKFSTAESEILFLRIDLSPVTSPLFQEEISLQSGQGLDFVINRYSLADLFASKIVAILRRTFRKGPANTITFKGRDYFDLIWFLEKHIKPNWHRAEDLLKPLKRSAILKELDQKVDQINLNYLREDLLPLFSETNFVESFIKNFSIFYHQNRGWLEK